VIVGPKSHFGNEIQSIKSNVILFVYKYFLLCVLLFSETVCDLLAEKKKMILQKFEKSVIVLLVCVDV
jgi:hypothetical protein